MRQHDNNDDIRRAYTLLAEHCQIPPSTGKEMMQNSNDAKSIRRT
jgi:hypothetical protein